jgi:hypothetical protein
MQGCGLRPLRPILGHGAAAERVDGLERRSQLPFSHKATVLGTC